MHRINLRYNIIRYADWYVIFRLVKLEIVTFLKQRSIKRIFSLLSVSIPSYSLSRLIRNEPIGCLCK